MRETTTCGPRRLRRPDVRTLVGLASAAVVAASVLVPLPASLEAASEPYGRGLVLAEPAAPAGSGRTDDTGPGSDGPSSDPASDVRFVADAVETADTAHTADAGHPADLVTASGSTVPADPAATDASLADPAGGAAPTGPAQAAQAAPSPAGPAAPQDGGGPAVGAPPGTTPAPAPGVVTGTLVRVWAEQLLETGAAHEDAVGADHEEHDEAGGATLQAWVETSEQAYRVSPTAVVGVEDGSTVTVDLDVVPPGGSVHPVLAVTDVQPAVQAAGSIAFGEGSNDLFGVAEAARVHDVTVVLAVPRGAAPDGTTAAAVASSVTNGVNTFWSQQSRGQRGVRVVATHGWQSLSSDCSNAFTLWDEVAAKVGWTGGTRRHLLVYLPPGANCGAGLGTLGSGPDVGGRSWVSYNSREIIAHELGHNLGLGHSDGLLCSGSADGSYSAGAWQSGCTVSGYRDYYDVMGISWQHLGSLAAPHADALGLLTSTEKLVTSQPVRVRLAPATSDGLRVLRIDDPAGAYYVEYRVATGWDAWLSNNWRGLDAGVLVHRRSPTDARKTLLLDGSVTSGDRNADWKSALAPGASLTTASGSTKIVVESASSTGATIVVVRNGVAPPAVTPPAGGAQVELRMPSTLAAASGTQVFSGVGTAPEGTLLWQVLQSGVVKASGTAQTGANGVFDSFSVPVALPAGTFTFRVWVPDESNGEGSKDPALMVDETTISLS